jgi:hypothetical protein
MLNLSIRIPDIRDFYECASASCGFAPYLGYD